MRLFDFFRLSRRPPTAGAAKERLQVLLALERNAGSGPDFLPLLQKELLDVIRKYIEVDNDKVSVELERGNGISVLEVNVELPSHPQTRKIA